MQTVVTLANWRLFNGMILRNTQCVQPVSDLHVYLESCNELQQQKLLGKPFIEFVQSDTQFLNTLTINGGSALFRLGNSMNHSCNPNVIITTPFNDHRIKVMALRDIKRGEELCFSYIDESQPLLQRQSELLQKYLFTCKCEKCSRELKMMPWNFRQKIKRRCMYVCLLWTNTNHDSLFNDVNEC